MSMGVSTVNSALRKLSPAVRKLSGNLLHAQSMKALTMSGRLNNGNLTGQR